MKMKLTIDALSALAQETRLAIFRALVRAHSPDEGRGGLAAGEIAERLGVAPATLSFHLKELAHAGLVVSRREGRSIIYKADLGRMSAVMGFLLEDCCNGACGTVAACAPQEECVS
ncbi:ArsR/SmtB family transcription factor [Parvibaculum indicum]|uniref:ArsR/SmtB family transcription factor n=1 Tax=Parvibaculum indicum TaxID=562969 RepID=UPI00142273BC|nr:metalloregulator ArsR/SmtB family transcription factor [Parvibaculum indicum]